MENNRSSSTSSETLLFRALRKVQDEGESRNKAGFWLATQLRDNGLNSDQAESVMLDYQKRVENLHKPPYAASEIFATLRQVYSRSPREPSGNGATPVATEGLFDEEPPEPMPERYERYVAECMTTLADLPGAMQFLMEKRGLSEMTILRAEIGYDEEDKRFTFPVRDRNGALWNVRRYRPRGDPKYKWLNTKDYGSQRLYGESAIVGKRWALVVAGELDCLLAQQLGFPAVTSTAGEGANFTDEMLAAFRGLEAVAILYDADGPGREGSQRRAAQVYGAEVVEEIKVPDLAPYAGDRVGYDLTDFVVKDGHSKAELRKLLKATPEWDPPGGITESRFDLGEFMRNPPDVELVAQGWLYRGKVHIWFGDAGCGKTWVALWAMALEIRSNNFVAYFDEENGPTEIAERLIALGVTDEQVDQYLLYFPDSGGFERKNLEKLVKRYQPTLAVYDTAIAFLARDDKEENSSVEVSQWFDEGPKVLAKLDKAPAVLVLDHVKLGADGKTRDPRGSGAKMGKAEVGVNFYTEKEERFERGGAADSSLFLKVYKPKDRSGRLDLPPEVQLWSSRGGGSEVRVTGIRDQVEIDKRRNDALYEKAAKAFAKSGKEELSATAIANEIMPGGQSTIKARVEKIRGLATGADPILIERATGHERPSHMYKLRKRD